MLFFYQFKEMLLELSSAKMAVPFPGRGGGGGGEFLSRWRCVKNKRLILNLHFCGDSDHFAASDISYGVYLIHNFVN